ncbi:MAG: bifunctional (p)ppGpp synthetase/guanosine-3',5'-bis(diphosphate) 3'-pyrophosphohydrolase, partial [Bdellovibrionota bacterium]
PPAPKDAPPEVAKEKSRYLTHPSFEDLKTQVASYFPEADFGLLQKAHDFAVSLHKGQVRKSGEPYIIHPVAVSYILATMKMDIPTILTGILHDVVEDTATTLEEVQKEFGAEVAQLVDGVTKISAISFKSKHEKQAENFRKMILAMAKDLRVIIVKLADRTHNMRTLQYLRTDKQEAIASETVEIYAPLANRLGISWMKIELEDLSLKYLKPEVYSKLSKLISTKKEERDKYTVTMIKILTEKISEYGLKVKVSGRAKHFHSIYKKMEMRNLDFEEIHDIVAFRITTSTIAECYEVLGIVHSFFKPVPGRFKDYIAMPKNNMYQSLHTTMIGPYGERMEVQIRTEEMHRVADSGVAAHWLYKEGKLNHKNAEKFHWLRQVIEAQETLDNSAEFLESLKLDLFAGEIYVFTPKGELREYPVGATPLDFAYSVHTDVGNKCIGAKVNGRMVPLKYKLRSGDTVEIITSPTQKPSKDWLKIVKSGRAKSKIRQFIQTEERDRARSLGRDMLEREFKRIGQNLNRFEKAKEVDQVVGQQSFASFEEMVVAVGYGKIPVEKVMIKLFPAEMASLEEKTELEKLASASAMANDATHVRQRSVPSSNRSPVLIEGIDDVLVRFAKCCNPLPGDEIVGFISRGRGVIVHRVMCPKALDAGEGRAVDVLWADAKERKVLRDVRVKIVVMDTQGLMNQMTKAISAKGINIQSINIKVNPDRKATGTFDLQVSSRRELLDCIKELEGVPGVISVEQF